MHSAGRKIIAASSTDSAFSNFYPYIPFGTGKSNIRSLKHGRLAMGKTYTGLFRAGPKAAAIGSGELAMSLRVSGKNLDVGLAFRTHIEERINATLAKYRAKLVAGHVTVEHEGSGFRTDCALHLSSGVTLQADAKAQDAYASFNRAADFIENQIRRHRERLVDHHAAPDSKTAIASPAREEGPEASLDPMPAFAADGDGPDLHPAVIAEPSSGIREMTVSGAARELDSTNAQVVVFRRASDGRMNVVYRRPDGNIGWIDPSHD